MAEGDRETSTDATFSAFQLAQSSLFPFLRLPFSFSYSTSTTVSALWTRPEEADGRNKARRCQTELSLFVSLSMERRKERKRARMVKEP